MPLKPEDIPYRIRIESPNAPLVDELGESRTTQWSEWATVWADVSPISAREAEFARSYAATVSHKIRLRYREGLLPTFRIKFRGRYFGIDGVVDVGEANIELQLYCTEKVG